MGLGLHFVEQGETVREGIRFLACIGDPMAARVRLLNFMVKKLLLVDSPWVVNGLGAADGPGVLEHQWGL